MPEKRLSTLQKLEKGENIILCRFRKWWRPVTCIWLSGTMLVNGVVVPLVQLIRTGNGQVDLLALSALVTAIVAAFAVREWGKVKEKELSDDDKDA